MMERSSFDEDRVWIMDPTIVEDSARDSMDSTPPPTLHQLSLQSSQSQDQQQQLSAPFEAGLNMHPNNNTSANCQASSNSGNEPGSGAAPIRAIGSAPMLTTPVMPARSRSIGDATETGGVRTPTHLTSYPRLPKNNGLPPGLRPIATGERSHALFRRTGKGTKSVYAGETAPERELTLLEKQYLLACERGDLASVRHYLTLSGECGGIVGAGASSPSALVSTLNKSCVDPLGRSALLIAIENENIEMIETLLEAGVETADALLYAINEENVEAVEIILFYLEKLEKFNTENQGVEINAQSAFTPDITPIILAAHRDNYEIIKLLLDRGASIPHPHDVRCSCKECLHAVAEDSLRLSRSRINAYRALASPSLICLSARDPILYAFELSWELRRLSTIENEFRLEYEELSQKCQKFAVDMLDQTRGSKELEIILNHDTSDRLPLPDREAGERMQLTRLKLAIQFRQKRFVAHPNCQQLLSSIWYEGLPGFRRRNIMFKVLLILGVSVAFPFLAMAYLISPRSTVGQFMKKPFVKFLCHSASYCVFLCLLILASQRINYDFLTTGGGSPTVFLLGNNRSHGEDPDRKERRGPPPSPVEWAIMAWVAGLIWTEIKQLWDVGLYEYCHNMWNMLDFITNSLYLATLALRAIAYCQVEREMHEYPELHLGRNIQRRDWDAWDPTLISECVFATANIFSSLKLVQIFTVNPHLGPLQISLGRMVIDILKFFFVYCLVLFAFACGLNQLMWYYATMRSKDCDEGKRILKTWGKREELLLESCDAKYSSFANLYNTVETLFWSIFGLVDLEHLRLKEEHHYMTEWAGKTMFGTYGVISIVVLLNMLVAMMSNSYQYISNQSDAEWKFARSRLFIEYFEEGATLPAPFNIVPSPKSVWHMVIWVGDKFCHCSRRFQQNKQRSLRLQKILKAVSSREANYQFVMRNLVKRFVAHTQRVKQQSEGVSEDDVNEIKQDISAFRYELLEILRNAGYNTGHANVAQKTNYRNKRRTAQAERRLMKGFQINVDPIPEIDRYLPRVNSQDASAGQKTTTTTPGPGGGGNHREGDRDHGDSKGRSESPGFLSSSTNKLNRLRRMSKKLPLGKKWVDLTKHGERRKAMRCHESNPDLVSASIDTSGKCTPESVELNRFADSRRSSAIFGPQLEVGHIPSRKGSTVSMVRHPGLLAMVPSSSTSNSLMPLLDHSPSDPTSISVSLGMDPASSSDLGLDPPIPAPVVPADHQPSSSSSIHSLKPQPTSSPSLGVPGTPVQTYASARPARYFKLHSCYRPPLLHQPRQYDTIDLSPKEQRYNNNTKERKASTSALTNDTSHNNSSSIEEPFLNASERQDSTLSEQPLEPEEGAATRFGYYKLPEQTQRTGTTSILNPQQPRPHQYVVKPVDFNL